MTLVTGGTGIVGSRLLYDLLRGGFRVKALKRATSNLEYVREVFRFYDAQYGLSFYDQIHWVESDILDVQGLEDAFTDVDEVYHAAAMVSYNRKDAVALIETNYGGTANVVNMAVRHGIRKFCHVSSVAALGQPKGGEAVSEKDVWIPEHCKSSYSLSKFMAEREVWRGFAEGLDTVIINPSIILGPGDKDQSSGMLLSILSKGIAYYPKGSAGFVDVRDVSCAAIALMQSSASGSRYILNAENLTYESLLQKAATIFGQPVPLKKAQPWMLEVAWVLDGIRSKVMGVRSKITKETARSASDRVIYQNAKIIMEIGIEFMSVSASLDYFGSFAQALKSANPSH